MAGRLSTLLTIIALCAIPLPFVPFAVDYVPISDLDWRWSTFPPFTLVVPCIALPPIISIGYIVWHVTGRLPTWAPTISYGLAAVFASAFLASLLNELDVSDPFELFLISLFLFAFAGAAWLSLKGLTQHFPIGGLIFMQCVYATLMAFAIATANFWGELQIGAWLGVTALLAYLAQITTALKHYRLSLVFIVPVALIGWIFSVN